MTTEYRIDWTDKRGAKSAIAAIKECGGRFDGDRKVWVVDPANLPIWQLKVWQRYAEYAGIDAAEIIAGRIGTMTSAELVTR